MGSALLDSTIAAAAANVAGNSSTEALRLEVAERLAAHRSRRAGPAMAEVPPVATRRADSRAARIAAAVAQRYANSPTYRAFLAAEAERAVEQARAAAEVAALNAMAVAAAQQNLLDAFDNADDEPDDEPGADEPGAPGQTAPSSDLGLPPQARANPHEDLPHALNLWPDLNLKSPHKTRSVILSEARRESQTSATGAVLSPSKEPATPSNHRSRTHHSSGEARISNLEPRTSNSPLTVRLYEDEAIAAHFDVDLELSRRTANLGHANRRDRQNDAEARALDEEIAFRRAPVFEEPPEPAMPLPANLIEFPRQLVASRKARPRYAEGPLRDESTATPADCQLRIFEVDPAQISTSPAAIADSASGSAGEAAPAPQWTSIWLDAPAPERTAPEAETAGALGTRAAGRLADPGHLGLALPQVASLGRRVLAGAVNGSILVAGLAAFAAAFALTTGHAAELRSSAAMLTLLRELAGRAPDQAGLQIQIQLQPSLMLAAAAIAGGFLYLLYQGLFFSLNQATPGMRCARIALCTFEDENPTRTAMRRRILAVLLSACPFGLGFLWAALDEDRLAWHDRVSRMYQRSY
jgi:uncharacterized RDD family membrane protein YckC